MCCLFFIQYIGFLLGEKRGQGNITAFHGMPIESKRRVHRLASQMTRFSNQDLHYLHSSQLSGKSLLWGRDSSPSQCCQLLEYQLFLTVLLLNKFVFSYYLRRYRLFQVFCLSLSLLFLLFYIAFISASCLPPYLCHSQRLYMLGSGYL